MSGKRQHFIPRFLMENFSSRMVKDGFYTWVYRRNAKEYETNIINVGVEGYFYTQGDDTEVDDLITDDEVSMSETLRSLLNSSIGSDVSSFQVSRLIVNLEVRTRHLRRNLLQTGEYAMSRFIDFMEDKDSFLRYLEKRFRKNPLMLKEAILNNLVEQGIPRKKIPMMAKLILPVAQNSMHMFLKPLLPLLVSELRSKLPQMLQETAKNSHIRALKADETYKIRMRRYENFVFTIRGVHEGNMILGDSVILFQVPGSKPFKSFIVKDEEIKAIFLPLSPERILVGSQTTTKMLPSHLRQAIARCSLEYFISASNETALGDLKEQIGKDAPIFSEEEMDNTIMEAINR